MSFLPRSVVSAPPDLSVFAALLSHDVLRPASASSPPQGAFRRDLFPSPSATFDVSAASGSVRAYEATFRSIVPKVASKLGPQVLPMRSEAQFCASFGSALTLVPKTASPVSSQPGVRWSYVKLVKAAVAHWRATRGERAVFDAQWTPRMGVFGAGLK